ncbi:MAG: serine/threonine protein phosphatase [Deltaproteobacteria bacterium]|nr:serine/threonine protein phosphatase [Deltaproteobacteria bacterium]
MEERRIFAVGDIHGCRAKLDKLLEKIDWRPENQEELVFLGDYIDRGPDSFGVVETVIALKEAYPRVVTTLKGNHEQMFTRFITLQEDLSLRDNGVATTMKSYDENSPFPASHLRFYLNLELYYETEKYIFVHAGLRPGIPLSRQSEDDCLWIRNEFLESDFDFGKTVVFGHTPLREPFICAGRAGLDTGAVFGGPLTCAELVTGKIISV